MSRGGSSEKAAEAHPFAYQRAFHEIDVPDEAGEQSAESKKYASTIGAERVATSHRVGKEGGPQSHQNAGHDASDDALFRERAACGRQTAVGFSIENNGQQRADDAKSKQRKISYRLLHINKDHTHPHNRAR